MELTYCAQCGREFEGDGIRFRGRLFCGDECCEEFEAEVVAKGEPGNDDLDDDEVVAVDLDDDELDYQEDDSGAKNRADDDFDIDPNDF